MKADVKYSYLRMTSGLRCDVREIYSLLGYYAEKSGNSLQAFRDIESVSCSWFKKSKKNHGLTTFHC